VVVVVQQQQQQQLVVEVVVVAARACQQQQRQVVLWAGPSGRSRWRSLSGKQHCREVPWSGISQVHKEWVRTEYDTAASHQHRNILAAAGCATSNRAALKVNACCWWMMRRKPKKQGNFLKPLAV